MPDPTRFKWPAPDCGGDGRVIWDFVTLQEFQTVNGVEARGGSLNATGPTIAAGMVYANSGYSQVGGMAGNVLLAFSADDP